METIRCLLTEEEIAARADAMAKKISEEYAGKSVHLVGVLKGCVFFMCEIAKRLTIPATMDFMSVSSYGDATVSDGCVRVDMDLSENIRGKDVILVEDIIDTGHTLSKLVPMLKKREPASFRIITLLDKPSRRIQNVEVWDVGFEVPDAFVVGYGLDYAQKYRNLPYIGVVEFGKEEIEGKGENNGV